MIKFAIFYAVLIFVLYMILMKGFPIVKENKWKYLKNFALAVSIAGTSGLIMFLFVELF